MDEVERVCVRVLNVNGKSEKGHLLLHFYHQSPIRLDRVLWDSTW